MTAVYRPNENSDVLDCCSCSNFSNASTRASVEGWLENKLPRNCPENAFVINSGSKAGLACRGSCLAVASRRCNARAKARGLPVNLAEPASAENSRVREIAS